MRPGNADGAHNQRDRPLLPSKDVLDGERIANVRAFPCRVRDVPAPSASCDECATLGRLFTFLLYYLHCPGYLV